MNEKINIKVKQIVITVICVFVLAGCTEKPDTEKQVQPAALAEQAVNNEPNEMWQGNDAKFSCETGKSVHPA